MTDFYLLDSACQVTIELFQQPTSAIIYSGLLYSMPYTRCTSKLLPIEMLMKFAQECNLITVERFGNAHVAKNTFGNRSASNNLKWQAKWKQEGSFQNMLMAKIYGQE